jgi:hypothetical protein
MAGFQGRSAQSRVEPELDSVWHSRLFEQSGGAFLHDGVPHALPKGKRRFRTHSGPMPLQPMPRVQRFALRAQRHRVLWVWAARACAVGVVGCLVWFAA